MQSSGHNLAHKEQPIHFTLSVIGLWVRQAPVLLAREVLALVVSFFILVVKSNFNCLDIFFDYSFAFIGKFFRHRVFERLQSYQSGMFGEGA